MARDAKQPLLTHFSAIGLIPKCLCGMTLQSADLISRRSENQGIYLVEATLFAESALMGPIPLANIGKTTASSGSSSNKPRSPPSGRAISDGYDFGCSADPLQDDTKSSRVKHSSRISTLLKDEKTLATCAPGTPIYFQKKHLDKKAYFSRRKCLIPMLLFLTFPTRRPWKASDLLKGMMDGESDKEEGGAEGGRKAAYEI